MFITFEGIEGSGKSLQLRLLKKFLQKNGFDVIATREPGGTELGKKIRNLLLSPKNRINSYAELFLLLADRAQHIEDVILKNINEGKIVLCDRYFDSTIAYQGGGRRIPDDVIYNLINLEIFSLKPDITFLFDLPVEISLKRLKKTDRIESQEIEFHRRVRRKYLEIAELEKRIFLIDGNEEIKSIHKIIREKTLKIIKEKNL